MTAYTIQSFEEKHHQWAIAMLGSHMGSHRIVTRGVLYNPLAYPGVVAVVDTRPAALITYHIAGDDCELLTVHSQVEGLGLGSALIDEVRRIATRAGCKRLWLITTNDNIPAIRWYQKRGFTIAAIYINALEESRKIKPEIPLTGFDGIPLRDEIEFEMSLK